MRLEKETNGNISGGCEKNVPRLNVAVDELRGRTEERSNACRVNIMQCKKHLIGDETNLINRQVLGGRRRIHNVHSWRRSQRQDHSHKVA